MFAQWDDHEVRDDWGPGELVHRSVRRDLAAARGARLPRLPRIHADARDAGRARPRLSQDRLRSAARRVHARHAQLSRTERRGRAGQLRPGRPPARAEADRLAQARARRLARDLEGDRRRPAARARERRRGRLRRRPAVRARAGDRRPALLHQARRRAQHGVDHRRRALHGGAPLRSEPRPVPGFRAVLGIRLRPDPCGHVVAERSRQHVRPAGDVSEGARAASRPTCRRASACSSSATWRSTVPAK